MAQFNLTKSENLNAEQLCKKIKQARKAAKKGASSVTTVVPKLKFTRGKLFYYEVKKVPELGISCVECGFGILHQLEKGAPKNIEVVETIKSGEKYLVKKSAAKSVNLNAYKAYLRRVVDGDTIHVVLDLGFKIFHEEVLRLRQIDAPEISTAEGKKSARELQKILKNLPFLIVKTHATDIYGRYLADVFLPDVTKKMSAEEAVERGEYLSQIFLDQKLALPFS